MGFEVIVGSVIGGLVQSNSARRAANAQTQASDAQLTLGREQMAAAEKAYNTQMGLLGGVREQNIGTANSVAQGARGVENRAGQIARNQAGNIYDRNKLITNKSFDQSRNTFQNVRDNSIAGFRGARDQNINDYGQARDTGIANYAQARDANLADYAQARDAGLRGYSPYAQSGQNALAALSYEMGIGAKPADFAGLSLTPAAQFAMQQGRDSVEAGAAAGGATRSGATVAALERLRSGLATQDRETQLDRLSGLSDMGMSAQGAMAQLNANYANNAGGARDTYASGVTGLGNLYAQNVAGARDTYASGAAGARSNYANQFGALSESNRNAQLSNSTGYGTSLANIARTRADNLNAINATRGAGVMGERSNYAIGAGNAAGLMGQSGMQAAQFMGNALASRGNAQAAGAVGMGNAFSDALNNGISAWQFNKLFSAGQPAAPSNPFFGGGR